MQFQSIMPVLKVTDFETSVKFYQEVLGFTLRWSANHDGSDVALLVAGSAEVMLSNGTHLGGNPAFTGTLYFSMTGVREYWEKLKGCVDVVWPLDQMDYGSVEFGIHDIDGYTLAFSEPSAG